MSSFSQLGQYPNNINTPLPGRWVDPERLESVLNKAFDDKYAVSMRNNSYTVWAPRELNPDEKKMCLRPTPQDCIGR